MLLFKQVAWLLLVGHGETRACLEGRADLSVDFAAELFQDDAVPATWAILARGLSEVLLARFGEVEEVAQSIGIGMLL